MTIKEKATEVKEKAKTTYNEKVKPQVKNAVEWSIEHWYIVGPAATFVGNRVKKYIDERPKEKRIEEQKYLKEIYVWDPSLGHYWQLRRPLTNSEWLEIDRRRGAGERMSTILTSLRVLK